MADSKKMKSIIRPLGVSMVLGCATAAWAQSTGPKIDRVDVKFVGPASVSEEFIRSNIKLKSGASYQPGLTQDDVHLLYGTGQFYNIRVQVDQADDGGVVLTYVVQVRPRITEIKFEGNKKLSDSKLKKKVTFKVGEALDEQKVFTDVQEMKKLYEKYGLADTTVKYVLISRN
jgi:outer membrane protein insertion porin family